uniref:Uncharacterized protein LOC116941911 isoform X2 n=1 Tax=Petromyzon marinus TaxID=7757 RepID=A0AAJ7T2E9_PETMA|nr:uncharacterized protein LOC116941911 isoform X2 [Petromyzon marinus]
MTLDVARCYWGRGSPHGALRGGAGGGPQGRGARLGLAARGARGATRGPALHQVGPPASPVTTKLYSEDGEHIVLVCTEDGTFYAMDSACPHEGGPLELGDIEDLGSGKLALICPWHHFDFCLNTGESSTGLKNQVYEVTVVDGNVYIKTENMLSISDTGQREDVCKGAVGCGESTSGQGDDSLCYWAVKILSTPDPEEKVQLTLEVQRRWEAGEVEAVGCWMPPDQPPRAADLAILEPGRIKRGKGGTLGSRIALLHSLANIEQWAIDLSWDIIARFSDVRTPDETPLPRQFFSDFVKVAGDEAKHFKLLETRIRALGSHFGALPVHNGLWQSARETSRRSVAVGEGDVPRSACPPHGRPHGSRGQRAGRSPTDAGAVRGAGRLGVSARSGYPVRGRGHACSRWPALVHLPLQGSKRGLRAYIPSAGAIAFPRVPQASV